MELRRFGRRVFALDQAGLAGRSRAVAGAKSDDADAGHGAGG